MALKAVNLSEVNLDEYDARPLGERSDFDTFVRELNESDEPMLIVPFSVSNVTGLKRALKAANLSDSFRLVVMGKRAAKTITRKTKAGKTVRFDREVWASRDLLRIERVSTEQ